MARVTLTYSSWPCEEGVVQGNPLLLASMDGYLHEVQYLVDEVKMDINQRGNFKTKYSFYPINGSALHAAVVGGQLHVVNYLVNCCQLDIDAQTKAIFEDDPGGGSTALHLAIYHLDGEEQKEIITCLLEHGADWAITDDMGRQCWALTFDLELTKLLILYGVGLGSNRNVNSSNIAHKWARSSNERSAEVVALAIDKGIDINKPDLYGLTPLMTAAIGVNGKPNVKVIEVILKQNVVSISPSDEIITLQLMGATFISDGQLNDGIKSLRMAMERRSNFGMEPLIAKPPMTLTEDVEIAFKNHYEVQTMKELDIIALDSNLLKAQAHLIRLRILGLKHYETLNCLTTCAFSVWYNESQTFLNYLHLILKGFESTKASVWLSDYSKLIALSLIAITRPSNGMPANDVSTFNNAMPILCKLVSLLRSSSKSIDFILSTIVDLTHVMLHNKPLTLQESTDLKSCLHQAVRLQKRNSRGLDLFLIACSSSEFSVEQVLRSYGEDDSDEEDDEISQIHFRRIVSAKTISLFIEVDGDINSVSKTNDTGLHILAKSICFYECMPSIGVHSHILAKIGMHFDAYTSSIRTLYEAGVRLDQKNSQEKTMADIFSDHGIKLESLIISAGFL